MHMVSPCTYIHIYKNILYIIVSFYFPLQIPSQHITSHHITSHHITHMLSLSLSLSLSLFVSVFVSVSLSLSLLSFIWSHCYPMQEIEQGALECFRWSKISVERICLIGCFFLVFLNHACMAWFLHPKVHKKKK